MKTFILDKLQSIEHFGVKKITWYKYRKKIIIFGITLQKEGIYDLYGNYLEKTPKGFTVKNKEVYRLPRVEMTFTSGEKETRYFERYHDAIMYFIKITDKLITL